MGSLFQEHGEQAKSRPCLPMIVCLLLPWLLSGCLLVSGERSSVDHQELSGNLSSDFVSAEGATLRDLRVAEGTVGVQVIVIVAVESGDLRIDVLDAEGAVVFSVAGEPAQQVTRSSIVRADERGNIRYRVAAQGARNGSYQILYQRP
jgi:hypothetical protein